MHGVKNLIIVDETGVDKSKVDETGADESKVDETAVDEIIVDKPRQHTPFCLADNHIKQIKARRQ